MALNPFLAFAHHPATLSGWLCMFIIIQACKHWIGRPRCYKSLSCSEAFCILHLHCTPKGACEHVLKLSSPVCALAGEWHLHPWVQPQHWVGISSPSKSAISLPDPVHTGLVEQYMSILVNACGIEGLVLCGLADECSSHALQYLHHSDKSLFPHVSSLHDRQNNARTKSQFVIVLA